MRIVLTIMMLGILMIIIQKRNIRLTEKAEISVIENGPIRMVIRVVHLYLDSRIQQDLIFYSHQDRIDLQYQIDWREKQIY